MINLKMGFLIFIIFIFISCSSLKENRKRNKNDGLLIIKHNNKELVLKLKSKKAMLEEKYPVIMLNIKF